MKKFIFLLSCLVACNQQNDIENPNINFDCSPSYLQNLCPVGTIPNLNANIIDNCSANYTQVLASENMQQICVNNGICQVICNPYINCENGIKSISKEGIICNELPTKSCGNGICEVEEQCELDCSGVCIEGTERCNGYKREICNRKSQWEIVSCSQNETCSYKDNLTVCEKIEICDNIDNNNNTLIDENCINQVDSFVEISNNYDMKLNEDSTISTNENNSNVADISIDQQTNITWILMNITAQSRTMHSDMAKALGGRDYVLENEYYISKTEVTVGQYRKCYDAGICVILELQEGCNWDYFDLSKDNHPMNCLTWLEARTFAKWVGGDLPSDVQWEYAARSQGLVIQYPWGNEAPTCEYAVMHVEGFGCGQGGTWGVCSKPRGNTLQGLCDMGGNVSEWTLDDTYHESDDSVRWPINEKARCINPNCESSGGYKYVRGGDFTDYQDYFFNFFSKWGTSISSYVRSQYIGFRVVKKIQ
jgi:hypothetical protein